VENVEANQSGSKGQKAFNAPKRFHECCDNQGPTILLVKANYGHIFGGYNATSWMSDFSYSNAPDCYLFSITDGKGRGPIKCPIRKNKADKAIK